MAIPRKEQIDPETPGYYHLISRCVRRTFLCGVDVDTGINYEHRRQWIENRTTKSSHPDHSQYLTPRHPTSQKTIRQRR